MKKNTQASYDHLHTISRHTKVLSGIYSLLDWDHETYMPFGASGIRGEQCKVLAGLIHKEKTSPQFVKALSKLIDLKTGKVLSKDLDQRQLSALKEWRRDYLKDVCLPAKFVEEFAQVTSQGIMAWRSAKQEDAFNQFAPFLEKIIDLNRQKADCIGFDKHPYDALLDYYEHDVSTEEIDRQFKKLRTALVKLLKHIQSAKQIDDSFLYGSFDTGKQMEFGKMLLKDLGFDLSKGRLDTSSHPFSSSSHPTDSRITTRLHPTSLMSSIFSVIHECGHSLYEMGLPQEEYGTPLGEAISLGMHESQSRWWETRIGRSKSFWKHYYPKLQNLFGKSLSHVPFDAFYRGINKVEPSFIRVEADEVTYSLHVILRFEIEKQLIEGNLKVRDLPEAWNSKMKELLGVVPKSNAEGCLQDIHWSMGSFGYFPTYTLGNLYASQLFTAFEKDFSDWDTRIQKGEFLFIKEWLHQNVHQHGRRYSSKELLKNITGKEFSSDAYIDYLTQKYKEIYK